MRNKIVHVISLILGIIGIVLSIILFDYNNFLENQIAEKNSLLEKSEKNDSLLMTKSKKYTDEIKTYIQGCEFILGEKKVSPGSCSNCQFLSGG